MMISHGFDLANKQRRLNEHKKAINTATKINQRLLHFMKDVQSNSSLTEGQKKEIKGTLIKGI